MHGFALCAEVLAHFPELARISQAPPPPAHGRNWFVECYDSLRTFSVAQPTSSCRFRFPALATSRCHRDVAQFTQ